MRKKRVLFCTEATFLNTGYATYAREIMNYLHGTGKYELAELASYGEHNDPRAVSIPWKYFSAMLPKDASKQEEDMFRSKFTMQFGEYAFKDVCLEFRPDIVCDIRDFWMLEFQERSPYRKFYKWCIMPTVDAEPQATQWMQTYNSADACLTYSDWSGELLQKQSDGAINYIGSAPPSAHAAYSVIKDKKECRKELGLPEDANIIGTVMRNQRRKLYPDLFKTFKMILDTVPDPEKYFLYCHTSYPDMGWDLPELMLKEGITSKVIFTYICIETKKPYSTFFSGPTAISPFTNKMSGVIASVQQGASYDSLSTIMSSFDLYVQYANSEGFGLPQVEAAACGVPVAAVDYSAMHSVINQLGGLSLKTKALYKEMETGCMRAVPDNEYAAEEICKFFNLSEEIRANTGKDIKQNFLKHFQWDKSGQVWEKYFDSVEIEPDEKTWLSEPDIQQPADKPDEAQFNSVTETTNFLIDNVLCQPEEKNSFFSLRLRRDLLYRFATGAVEGIYMNDSSMVGDPSKKANLFNFDKAYDLMKNRRLEINMYENVRKRAFNL
jgi:glycosyltransferase involved in cell wall biosynthesis